MSARAKGVVIIAAACFFASQGHHHGHHSGGGTTLTDSAISYSGGYTSRSWARAFLKGAHLPRTGCNVAAVEAWQRGEGTYSMYLNPLDTTEREPGSYSINSVGVQHFPSWSEGLHASVVTLYNGHYPNIIAALRAGDSAQSVADAVQESPWGTGGFDASC